MDTIEHDFDLVKTEVLKRFKGAPEGVAGAVILMTISVLRDFYELDIIERPI